MTTIKTLAAQYAKARAVENKGADGVNAWLAAHYPSDGEKAARKAFERGVMLPYEMTRIIGDAARVAAFFALPNYATKPEGGEALELFNAYRAAITATGRLLDRAGIERGATRDDKGEKKSRAPRQTIAKDDAPVTEAPATEAPKPVKAAPKMTRDLIPAYGKEATKAAKNMRAQLAALIKTDKQGATIDDIVREYIANVERAGNLMARAIEDLGK